MEAEAVDGKLKEAEEKEKLTAVPSLVESNDTPIANKKISKNFSFKGGTLRELRDLKTLNGQLGDLNNKKLS